jgi:pantetheine-phosphate adenylyltransferase
VDVIDRAAQIFDHLVVAVAESVSKKPLFNHAERMELVSASVGDRPNVEVDSFSGLLVDYAHRKGVHVLVRGLRAFSDFEFEFQMALTNRKMAKDIETVFLMPREEYSYLSASAIREIASLGGPIGDFVPPKVAEALRAKFAR